MSSPDMREMFPAERQGRILEILAEQRGVRVSALSELLGVSEMTIRRDLERLETEGLLSRTHGGAILKQHIVEEPRYVDQRARARPGEAPHRAGDGGHDQAR